MTKQSGSNVTISQAQLESRTTQLSSRAFETFCSDIASMLGCEISSCEMDVSEATLADLKKQFKELVAVASIQVQGALTGTFYVIFDQEAFFTLAGVMVMLPDEIVMQNRHEGTLQSANEMGDAAGQISNLMVGSWNRAFRKEFGGNSPFLLSKTFIGNPWDNPEEITGLTNVSQLLSISYEIHIKQFPPAIGAVIYPKGLFETMCFSDKDVSQAEAEAMPAVTDFVAEAAFQSNDAQSGGVFESIRKITHSPAVLPGQGPDGSISVAQTLHSVSAQDVMLKNVVWADPEETVEQALARMLQSGSGYLLVGQNGILEGIVSKSDIRGATSPYLQEKFAKWRSPLDVATLQIRLKWVMSKPVHTVPPEASFTALVQHMCGQRIRALPVVDEKGSVMGIITALDIFEKLSSIS